MRSTCKEVRRSFVVSYHRYSRVRVVIRGKTPRGSAFEFTRECPPHEAEPLIVVPSGTTTSGSSSVVTTLWPRLRSRRKQPPGMSAASARIGLLGDGSETGTAIIEANLLARQRSAYRVQRGLRIPADSQGPRQVSPARGESLVVFGSACPLGRTEPGPGDLPGTTSPVHVILSGHSGCLAPRPPNAALPDQRNPRVAFNKASPGSQRRGSRAFTGRNASNSP